MAGVEKVRTVSGMWDPLKVRLELRQMFERWLWRSPLQRLSVETGEIVDELSILGLSRFYRMEYPGGVDDVAKAWDESEQRIAEEGPTFDELKRLGWIFFDGGRWVLQSVPLGTFSHVAYPSPSTKALLTGLGSVRLVAKTEAPPPEAEVLASKISSESWLDRSIPTKNPDWLSARLWERLCPKPMPRSANNCDEAMGVESTTSDDASRCSAFLDADPKTVDRAFLEWSAWCEALGCTARWDDGWGAIEKQYCREAAYRVLDRQDLWGAWDNDSVRYAEVLEKTFAIHPDHLRYAGNHGEVPPRTLVSREDWLSWPGVEHLMMGRLGWSTISFAFVLLCSELENTGFEQSITTTATKVMSFAADHPMALQHIMLRIDAAPALLVDMLMNERVACLAAKLVIEWRPKADRDSDLNLSREAQTKDFAIQDALSFLAYHLNEGTLNLEECASLITWCFADGTSSRRAAADSRRSVGRQLLETVATKGEEVQSEVLQHLVSLAAYKNNVPRACFTGVLNGLGFLPSALSAKAFPIVALYARFAQDFHLDWTDVSSLPAELAARLVATAFSKGGADRDALLIPFDSAKLLRNSQGDDSSFLRTSFAQTLRGHVRLLSRAVSGWTSGAVPTELCAALQSLISRSVIEHSEKGRIGAITDKYSPRRFLTGEEGSPAQDLTAAWRRLDSNDQESMLQTLSQADDPVLLAELCRYLPAAAKPIIQARLRQLKPGEASELWTWPEVQRRVASLVEAGEYALAREHLNEATQHLSRAPTQFRLALFGLELQLLLKEKNWSALDSAALPLKLDEAATRQARDQLDFYSATSQLLRPNGNLADARIKLQHLATRPGAASVYKENVFAVAIQQLLGPTLSPLADADKVTGEALLAEINAALANDGNLARSNLLSNRALLLLALKRPEDALESVATRRRETRSPDLELIAALAKSEMGLRRDAMAILDAAITEFGIDDRLVAAKSDLQAGDPIPSVASIAVDIEPISNIRAALQQLTELLPSQIGDVLGPPGRGIRGYLVRQVSRAVATLQHMAAMLRDRQNQADEARFENDLNTAVREVLGASLAVIKWDVSDQSLGGTTSNGNPGERDAVIRASGQEISIYEALVCSGLNRSYTKKHFDKLLSYGVCDIYFHVTYSYAEKLEPLLGYVRQMLEHEVPPGLTYLGCEILEPPDYEIRGYIATYRADHRELAVVFLIADLKV